jgi:hypothetical protein
MPGWTRAQRATLRGIEPVPDPERAYLTGGQITNDFALSVSPGLGSIGCAMLISGKQYVTTARHVLRVHSTPLVPLIWTEPGAWDPATGLILRPPAEQPFGAALGSNFDLSFVEATASVGTVVRGQPIASQAIDVFVGRDLFMRGCRDLIWNALPVVGLDATALANEFFANDIVGLTLSWFLVVELAGEITDYQGNSGTVLWADVSGTMAAVGHLVAVSPGARRLGLVGCFSRALDGSQYQIT